jgi:sugar/nucleoside kinase (ribokinase family)
LRIGIASHIVLDTIKSADGSVTESVGGPPCYCGITSRRFGFGVSLATRVGKDFPQEMHSMLRNNDIILSDRQVSDTPTTRFGLISEEGESRRLVLSAKCDPLTVDEVKDMKVDCWLASPVIDEIPSDVLGAIKQNRGKKDFVMLDPQGYLRTASSEGQVMLKDRLDLDLSGITAIKVDSQEMFALTGLKGLQGMQALQSRGVRFVVSTEHHAIHLLYQKTHYWIRMRDVDTPDSTGAGDILCAAFACSFLKEKDPLWAICFGAGAVRAALETKQVGLAKIPSMPKIEQSASYFYNTVGFQQLS